MGAWVRVEVRVEGVVQGVGFRPFVHGLATGLGLAGRVGNDVRGVFAEVTGVPEAVEEFLLRLTRDAPPLARVERVTAGAREPVPAPGGTFSIAASQDGGPPGTLISPDTATCADCLAELADPEDRRHRHPFVNCVNCGPRLSIVRGVPYDRALTTMAAFAMCAACAREYHDPADRRFHAQPVCCPDCGPELRLIGGPSGGSGEPVAEAARVLRAGGVLAVKGVGGFHLAAPAADERAVAELRARKRREERPLAVMVADLAGAAELCEVDAVAAALLTGADRPIVLLPRAARPVRRVAEGVAPGTARLGVLLPYTPVHHLLLAEVAEPIVLTSGNLSDEPIAYADDDAMARLGGVADAFLTHDRPIDAPVDDSVVRPHGGRALVLRRSRGHAPAPVTLPWAAPRHVLGCGAALKSTFCLVKGDRAILSQHFGDLSSYETLRCYVEGIARFAGLFGVHPELVAHDLHPEYLSTKHALDLPGVETAGVQHHHAHIASCLVDNGERGPVIGVAFDGLGFGADGTLWGGEFLVADLVSYRRAGHLDQVPMPGGPAAVRQPWRMAAAYLAGLPDGLAAKLDVARRNESAWEEVAGLARRAAAADADSPLRRVAPPTSSAGRLFDAVAALAGVRDTVTYEGQAAAGLEELADPAERGRYRAPVTTGDPLVASGSALVAAAADDLLAGVPSGVVAARFHNGLAGLVVTACRVIRDGTGLTTAALSGGVFQNALLLERTTRELGEAGFRVLTHERIPPNDGGISLGQAAVAAARDHAGVYGGA
ncbi:carbamoyltransferase HypF [Spongiactinospora sp. TRM90649]|uniref:carbamoyltransferase HypF n=1 Tax=Spongiactinospora sp. TRM90649 TaxID=3031114 RepID=UPI0023F7F841|nr:carbamoyltransferase HypF [Spongiactinospora sp. TRM90649]MDF5751753.1 carbamoyltransferase HypF [Spongiactinospora sp. TRM90649]